MAIIYSYSLNADLLASDMLVGTATKLYAGKPKNETKNFSLGDLAYFISTSEYNTLDAVLHNGNTSLLGANVGEIGIWDAAVLSYAEIKVTSSEFNFYSANYPLNPIVAFDSGSIVFNNMMYTSTISTGTITGNRVYTLPDSSGTIALISDIPNPIALTTIGTSGPATLIGDVLNIPEYASGDKTYIFIQSTPAATWTITHNLNKYPSVSVVNTNNIVVYGQTTYINANELQIEFSAGFSGKAYMN